MAKDIDGQLKQMVQDLKSIIDHLNTANTQQQDNEDPVRTSITLDIVQWYQSKEVISIQVVSIRPQALRLRESLDHFNYILGEYSSFFKPSTWNFLQLVSTRLVLKRLCKETTGNPKFNASRRLENRSKPSSSTTARKKMEGLQTTSPPAPPPGQKKNNKINKQSRLHPDFFDWRRHWNAHRPGVFETCGDEQWKCFIKETIQLSHHQCNTFLQNNNVVFYRDYINGAREWVLLYDLVRLKGESQINLLHSPVVYGRIFLILYI